MPVELLLTHLVSQLYAGRSDTFLDVQGSEAVVILQLYCTKLLSSPQAPTRVGLRWLLSQLPQRLAISKPSSVSTSDRAAAPEADIDTACAQ